MRVIFLDFDGVVVVPPRLREVDSSKRIMLEILLRASGAVLVVTSTWRRNRAKAELEALLRLPVYDVTPVLDVPVGETGALVQAPERGCEIQAWLATHPDVTSYVVIDDDADRGPIPAERWVQTTFEFGLTMEAMHAAMMALGPPYVPRATRR